MPKEFFKKAGDAGLLCPQVPEKYGGAGGDILDLSVISEEQLSPNMKLSRCNRKHLNRFIQEVDQVPYILETKCITLVTYFRIIVRSKLIPASFINIVGYLLQSRLPKNLCATSRTITDLRILTKI